ncbi:hypothetical protein VTP01DRAFT_150, partial [Rhizomucor pusillus]|uniref:uncharacterized protein n=1 Tax=Rhizomucor pusillus TaxID=4840 RepID=UPI0037438AEA
MWEARDHTKKCPCCFLSFQTAADIAHCPTGEHVISILSSRKRCFEDISKLAFHVLYYIYLKNACNVPHCSSKHTALQVFQERTAVCFGTIKEV